MNGKESPTLTKVLREMGLLPEGARVCGPPETVDEIESNPARYAFVMRYLMEKAAENGFGETPHRCALAPGAGFSR